MLALRQGLGARCCRPVLARPAQSLNQLTRHAAHLGHSHTPARGLASSAALRHSDQQLSFVAPENRKDVQRVLEIAERAATRWDVTSTDFLTPPVVADAMSVLTSRADMVVVPWGGYSQAERCRMVMGREEVLQSILADPTLCSAVAALQVTGNFMFDPAAHPDFLGACLGTGVVRERVGDILVQGERGAQILVDAELVEHFEMSLTQVRTVPVVTRRVELSALQVPLPSVVELQSVEASLRLDAIASAGFKMSRSKMTDIIKAGNVRVNWRAATRASVELQEGDLISCSGKGRLQLKTATLTKKDRYMVTMVRYT